MSARSSSRGADGSEPVLEQAEGLLEQIADTALDDDYYVVRAGHPQPSRSANTVLTGVAVGLFALMVTIAAVQTATDRPATEREQRALAEDVSVRRAVSAERRDTVEALRAQVRELGAATGQSDVAETATRLRTAAVAVQGPGLRLTVTPVASDGGRGDVTDKDLQALVNALWFVGAEAVSVNGQRIGTLTSIRTAGAAVTVNFVSISPPYEIRAIGDTTTMRSRLADTAIGRELQRRADLNGLGYEVVGAGDQTLGAIPDQRQRLRHAETAEEEAP